jgi:hypothetical protein
MTVTTLGVAAKLEVHRPSAVTMAKTFMAMLGHAGDFTNVLAPECTFIV